MKFIINADDFGVSGKVNRAIYKSAKNGYLTSSTIIAISDQLDEAIEMAHDLKNISFGVHLTLTDRFDSESGIPLISSSKESLLTGWLNIAKLNSTVTEFSMQIEKILNKGIEISHIDTHHHIHRMPLILIAAMKAGKKFNINKIRSERIPNNKMFLNKSYRSMHHSLVKSRGFIQPDYYTDFETLMKLDLSEFNNGVCEIMCHPGSSFNDEAYFNESVYSKFGENLINYNFLT